LGGGGGGGWGGGGGGQENLVYRIRKESGDDTAPAGIVIGRLNPSVDQHGIWTDICWEVWISSSSVEALWINILSVKCVDSEADSSTVDNVEKGFKRNFKALKMFLRSCESKGDYS